MRFQIVTSLQKFAHVAQKWKDNYCKDGVWNNSGIKGTDRQKTYESIVSAGADYEAIAKAIGNKSWTHFGCDCCGEYATVAAEIGEYDAKFVCTLCAKMLDACLSGVTEALKANRA